MIYIGYFVHVTNQEQVDEADRRHGEFHMAVEADDVTYKSVAGDPLMPFIRCSVPGSDTDGCRIFDWQNNQPEVDGEKETLFMAFEN
ncbi:MAG: hypothetical protein JRF23_05550 [Deltaproteobacteria bacterium]|nr:hypothetical protein [Deltaproteobacteria bacterium]